MVECFFVVEIVVCGGVVDFDFLLDGMLVGFMYVEFGEMFGSDID